MKAAVNTSPLIFLARLGQLACLPTPCATTALVLEEVRAGTPLGHGEAIAVDALVRDGRLAVHEAKPVPLPREAGLDAAEASVLQLALDLRVPMVVVDDRAALRAAKLLGLRARSTPCLLLDARLRGDLDHPGFQDLLDRLVAERYFLSGPIYHLLVETSRKPG